MCFIHSINHVHCGHRVSHTTISTCPGLTMRDYLFNGESPCCGRATNGGIHTFAHQGLPCCEECHQNKIADVNSCLRDVEVTIEQGLKDQKYDEEEYARLLAEAKGKSYWQLKLLNTPVSVSSWDGVFFKALKM